YTSFGPSVCSCIVLRHLTLATFPYTTLFRSQLLHDGSLIDSRRSATHRRADGNHRCGGAGESRGRLRDHLGSPIAEGEGSGSRSDRKSTRLNSSHVKISYAVFCLKKNSTTRW